MSGFNLEPPKRIPVLTKRHPPLLFLFDLLLSCLMVAKLRNLSYIVEECLSFCALYLGDDTVHKRNKLGRNVDAQGSNMREGFEIFKGPSKSLVRVKYFHLDHQEWDRAHIHVFWNTPEVQPYIREHVECEKATRRLRMTVLKSQHQAHKSFPQWFQKHIYNQIQNGVGQVSDDLRALASGPRRWAGL
ncbi:unnamed protein product [Prunus armeniaca]|uniref:Uncharacterized protein n=1 Tax=Prunus armeniaca TaxID=36596 RepID=A0A6J5W0X8_PRUAR|nr:unnamed protein product [Prunus armeniaca]